MLAACSKHEQTLLIEGQMPKQVPDFDLPSPSSESESHESVSEQEYDDDGNQGPSPSRYQDQQLKEMADHDVCIHHIIFLFFPWIFLFFP